MKSVLLYPSVKAVGGDIETCCSAGNRMATINNLLLKTLTAHMHLSLAILDGSEVSVKPVAIHSFTVSVVNFI